jgi:hypothetical protein
MEEDEGGDGEMRGDADADVEMNDEETGGCDEPEEASSNMPTTTNTKARRAKLISPFHSRVELTSNRSDGRRPNPQQRRRREAYRLARIAAELSAPGGVEAVLSAAGAPAEKKSPREVSSPGSSSAGTKSYKVSKSSRSAAVAPSAFVPG